MRFVGGVEMYLLEGVKLTNFVLTGVRFEQTDAQNLHGSDEREGGGEKFPETSRVKRVFLKA